jgi:[acyl-carrier-protein] S-malonyltransferase
VLQELKGSSLAACVVAGHSLGEYSALVAAEALDFAAAVKLVRNRGKYMQDAVPLGKGTMAAILGVEAPQLEEICKAATQNGEVAEPAGYNCPGQIIIAGHVPAVERAMKAVEEAGGKAIALNVSGPFHSSPLKVAGERLAKDLEHVQISNLTIPYVPNVTGLQSSENTLVKQNLVDQVSKAVRWEPSMRAMLNMGTKEFVEVGPGRVLLGFVKKLDRKFPALAVDDEKGWAALTA